MKFREREMQTGISSEFEDYQKLVALNQQLHHLCVKFGGKPNPNKYQTEFKEYHTLSTEIDILKAKLLPHREQQTATKKLLKAVKTLPSKTAEEVNKKVTKYLQKGAKPNFPDDTGTLPLHLSLKHPQVATTLLSNGASPFSEHSYPLNALFSASSKIGFKLILDHIKIAEKRDPGRALLMTNEITGNNVVVHFIRSNLKPEDKIETLAYLFEMGKMVLAKLFQSEALTPQDNLKNILAENEFSEADIHKVLTLFSKLKSQSEENLSPREKIKKRQFDVGLRLLSGRTKIDSEIIASIMELKKLLTPEDFKKFYYENETFREICKEVLKKGNFESAKLTPLHFSYELGFFDFTEEALKRSSPELLNARNKDGKSPIDLAFQHQQLFAFFRLMKAGCRLQQDAPKTTPATDDICCGLQERIEHPDSAKSIFTYCAVQYELVRQKIKDTKATEQSKELYQGIKKKLFEIAKFVLKEMVQSGRSGEALELAKETKSLIWVAEIEKLIEPEDPLIEAIVEWKTQNKLLTRDYSDPNVPLDNLQKLMQARRGSYIRLVDNSLADTLSRSLHEFTKPAHSDKLPAILGKPGINLNSTNNKRQQYTPVHSSVLNLNLEALNLLLAHQANPLALCGRGLSALDYALLLGFDEGCKALEARGAYKRDKGKVPVPEYSLVVEWIGQRMTQAVSNVLRLCSKDEIENLLNETDINGDTIYHHAIREGDPDLVFQLLGCGKPPLHIENHNGHTLVAEAIRTNHMNLAMVLIGHEGDKPFNGKGERLIELCRKHEADKVVADMIKQKMQ